MKKKVKKKINKKALLVVILIIYLFAMAFYYTFNLPVKLIIVSGNSYISDEEIISKSKITDKTKLLSLSSKSVIKNIKKIPLIENAKVTKHLNGRVYIKVNEVQVLYYKALEDVYILENGNKTSNIVSLGIPTLVNYVPSDIENNFIKKLNKLDKDILSKVSEIEYSPNIKDDTVIDKNRFLLRMNDGNYVYINLANINNLNKYNEIYATLDDEKGVLNLDSSSDNGIVFQTFEFLKKKEAMQNELSEGT